MRCVQFYWTSGCFSKTERRLQKTSRPALEQVKKCPSGLSLISLGLSAAQILVQKFTKFDRPREQFLQGNLFLLAVCTHEVPLYLCRTKKIVV